MRNQYIVKDNGEKLITLDSRTEANAFIKACHKEDIAEADFAHRYTITVVASIQTVNKALIQAKGA